MKPHHTWVVWDAREKEIVINFSHPTMCRDHIKEAMDNPDHMPRAVDWVVRACIVHPGPPYCEQCGFTLVDHDKLAQCRP